MEESLANTQKCENENVTSSPQNDNYMPPKWLDVPTALGDYQYNEDYEDESLEELLSKLEKNKSWIFQYSGPVLSLVILATLGLLWCICNKFSRRLGEVGAAGAVGAVGAMATIIWFAIMDPTNLDIMVGAAGAMGAVVGAAMGAMDRIDLDILMGAMVVGGAEVAVAPVAPPDFRKTANAMSTRGA